MGVLADSVNLKSLSIYEFFGRIFTGSLSVLAFANSKSNLSTEVAFFPCILDEFLDCVDVGAVFSCVH